MQGGLAYRLRLGTNMKIFTHRTRVQVLEEYDLIADRDSPSLKNFIATWFSQRKAFDPVPKKHPI